MKFVSKWLTLLLAACAIQNSVWANKTDAGEPVRIEADSVEIREKDGISIYQGHVIATRGSMELKGDRIEIYSDKNRQLDHIHVSGDPARFHQLTDSGEEVQASSQEMFYRADNGIIELKGNAEVIQQNNRFTSAQIIYDTKQDTVAAQGDDKSKERVTITIQPEPDDQDSNSK